jgi:hypothetical protein
MNTEKRAAKFTHYQPKRWHPEFSLIVMGSIAGKSNVELSEQFGYTKEHISNILSTEQAAEIRERSRESLNKAFEGNLQSRIDRIGERAIANIERFVEDEHNMEAKSPFAFVDRMMKLATMTSKLGSADNGNKSTTNIQVNGSAAFVLQAEQVKGIRDALLQSSSLDAVNVGDVVPDRDVESPKLKLLNG